MGWVALTHSITKFNERGETKMNDDLAKKHKAIIAKTKKKMVALDVYKAEFDAIIDRYADATIQYDLVKNEWFNLGCPITEEYTNKAGATNDRKSPVYLAIETLRKDLTDMENIMGLTPKGLKQLKVQGFEIKKESALGKTLRELDE